MKNWIRNGIIALVVVLALVGYIGWELWRSAYGLTVVSYRVAISGADTSETEGQGPQSPGTQGPGTQSPGIQRQETQLPGLQGQVPAASAESVRIVQLSDLHAMSFGENNADLVAAVRALDPDLIAMTGDMFSGHAVPGDLDLVCRLVEDLSDLAPVYYALGNHELAYMSQWGTGILTRLRTAGAVILDRDYVDISLAGRELRIGGCYGYLLSRHLRNGSEQDFMDEFLATDRTTVLLAHMSEGLLAYNCIDHWDVDLVLSGHAHGGQIRLPFIGGLYDPETGWFPKYTRGAFRRGDSVVVLSAGMGSSTTIPRFGNPPEIVVVDLTD